MGNAYSLMGIGNVGIVEPVTFSAVVGTASKIIPVVANIVGGLFKDKYSMKITLPTSFKEAGISDAVVDPNDHLIVVYQNQGYDLGAIQPQYYYSSTEAITNRVRWCEQGRI